MSTNMPSIGDMVLNPNDKFRTPDRVDLFNLLPLDGRTVTAEDYPLLLKAKAKEANHVMDTLDTPLELITGFPEYPATIGPEHVCVSGDGRVVYVTDSRTNSFYRSDDYGETMISLGTVVPDGFSHMACSADGRIVYLPHDDAIYRSEDFGETFTRKGTSEFTSNISISNVACSNDGTVVYFYNTYWNDVEVSFDSAETFTRREYRLNSGSNITCSGDGSIVYISTKSSGVIERSTDFGVTYTQVADLGFYIVSLSMDETDSQLYVQQFGGAMWLSKDGGETFIKFTSAKDETSYSGLITSRDGNYLYVLDAYWRLLYRTGRIEGTQMSTLELPTISSGTDVELYKLVADLRDMDNVD